MSRFQQLELQGPQVFKQPQQTMMYQESRTILPSPQVGVGMGIDFGAIGESVKNLGVGLVETAFQQEYIKKANAVKALQNKTTKLIEQHSDVNDMDGVDLTFNEYKAATRDILGFDPEVETDMLGPYGRLAEGINEYNANVDMARDKASRGWADEIESDNYDAFTMREIESFDKADDKVAAMNQRIENLKTVYNSSSGMDISENLPTTGFTLAKRRMLLKVKNDYVKLLEDQEKMTGGKGQMELAGESVRNQLRSSKTLFDEAERKKEEAAKIRQAGPLSPAEEATATQLEAEALRLAISAQQQKDTANYFLLRTARMQYISENRAEFEANYGKLSDNEYLELIDSNEFDIDIGIPEDPTSMEGFTFLMNSGINSETGSALAMAFEAEQKASTGFLREELKTSRELYTRHTKRMTDDVSALAQQTETELKMLDAAIKESTSEAEAMRLRIRKVQLIEQLEKKYRDQYIIPSLPKSLKDKSPALLSFMKAQQQGKHRQSTFEDSLKLKDALRISNSPSYGFGIGFDVDSLAILETAVGNELNASIPIYRESLKEVTRLKGLFADSPDGKSKSYQASLKERQDSISQYVRWSTGQAQQIGGLTPSNKASLTTIGLAARLSSGGFDESADIPASLQEAITILERNKDNPNFIGNKIPFGMNQFMLTSYYDEMLREAGRLQDSKAAIEYMRKVTDLFMTDVVDANGKPVGKFEDYIPRRGSPDGPDNGAPIVKTVKAFIQDPSKNPEVTAAAFMMLPYNTRNFVLQSISEEIRSNTNDAVKAASQVNLSWLEDMHNAYDEQQSVSNFLEGWKQSGVTPLQSQRADQLYRVLKDNPTVSSTEKRTDSFKKEFPEDYKFITSWQRKILSEVAKGVIIPGWDGNVESSNPQSLAAFNDAFASSIILHLVKTGWNEDGTISFDKPEVLTETISRVSNQLTKQGWKYSRNNGFTQELGTESVKTADTGPEQLTISGKLIEGATGITVPPENRIPFILSNGNFTVSKDATQTERQLFLGQVAQSNDIVPDDWKEISSNPFVGLITYGVVRNGKISRTTLSQLGTNQGAVLNNLVFAASSGMPQDNLGVLASTAAIALLPVDETNMGKATDFVAKTARDIRKALETGDTSVYSIDVVGLRSNDGKGSVLPTIRVSLGDKVLSTFQITTGSFNQEGPTKSNQTLIKALSKWDEKQLIDRFNSKTSENWYGSGAQTSRNEFTDAVAIQLLSQDPKRVLRAPAGLQWGGSRGGDYQPQYEVQTDAEGNKKIVHVPYLVLLGKRFVPKDAKTTVVYEFPTATPAPVYEEAPVTERFEDILMENVPEFNRQLNRQLNETQRAQELEDIQFEVERTVNKLLKLSRSPESIAAGKSEKKNQTAIQEEYKQSFRNDLIAEANTERFRSLPPAPTAPTAMRGAFIQQPESTFVTKPTILMDYDFVDTHFALNGTKKGINPEVVYHKGQYFLVPNPGSVDKEVLRGRLDRTKETFGSFETRREADDYLLSLNKHFDTVFRLWKNR